MAVIITYDVPSRHVELKARLFAIGYQDNIKPGQEEKANHTVYLPNTTLYHPTKTPDQALSDVRNACSYLVIKLERCISTRLSHDWMAIYGEPFK
jgi:hypothetical protein